MSESPWTSVELLEPLHSTHEFESGRDSVDSWFREKALANRQRVSTHVCVNDEREVIAFFALKTVIVKTRGMNNEIRNFGDDDGNATGILLAQMGVRKANQPGSGRKVLQCAFEQAVRAHRASRVSLFVVDAADESLVGYYQNAGLKHVPETLRLVVKMSKIEALFNEKLASPG